MENFLKIIEKDQLTEAVNIGVCGAINALSSLIGKSIYTCAPVFSTSIEEKINNSDSFDKIVVSSLDKGASGNVIFALSQSSASELTSLLSKNIKSDILGEKMNKSALCEVGNILTGACLSVVSKFTGVDLDQSIPYFTDNINDSNLNRLYGTGKNFIFSICFKVKNSNIKGKIMFLLNKKSASKIINFMDKKYTLL